MAQDKQMEEFKKDRDKAFTDYVMNDDISSALSYCLNYGIPLPDDIEVFKLGMYKAVFNTTSLPKEVRDKAAAKCTAMGYSPNIG